MRRGVLCAGGDRECLATGARWTFDHVGPSPDVKTSEQYPLATATPPKPVPLEELEDTTCQVGLAEEKNGFQTCNVISLSNGLLFFALAVCIAGILVSAILWAAGSKGQNPGQELTGKRGIIVCVVAALILGAVQPILDNLDTNARAMTPPALRLNSVRRALASR